MTRRFRAMNTDVEVVIVAGEADRAAAEAALSEIEDLFAAVEATLSRFRPESELSRLNRCAGEPFPASPLLYAVVEAALATARATNGLFDPTVLGALVAAGYDRSFELLATAPAAPRPTVAASPPDRASPGWSAVRLAAATRTITLPVGRGLDLGGIGKGWTVDRAVARLRCFGSFAIDAGGDLFAAGCQGNGAPWTVGVEDPRQPSRDLLVLAVRGRGVATSTTARRRWRQGDEVRHHLIDPRTGQPSQSGVMAATVVAGSVTRAETLAKVALLLGPVDGLRFLDAQPDAEGLLVLDDGRLAHTHTFREVIDAI